MTAGIEVALVVLAVIAAVSVVSLPFFRPPSEAGEDSVPAARDEGRARLFAALEELGRDRKARMISQADYTAAVSEIRRRLARL